MVQQGDFKVEIVEAESKVPFKEHHKDGKVYVEVEPEIEYFISIQKVGTSVKKQTYMQISIDGKDVPYCCHYAPDNLSGAAFRGLWSVSGGRETTTALKFEKPRATTDGSTRTPPSQLMGTIEVKLYESVFQGYGLLGTVEKGSVGSEIDSALSQGLKGKKVLRSTAGTNTVTRQARSGQVPRYTKGPLYDTITLDYCAAVGLIVTGVLPKPTDIYEHHRMVQKFTRVRRRDEGPAPMNQGESIDLIDDSEEEDAKDEKLVDGAVPVKDENAHRNKQARTS